MMEVEKTEQEEKLEMVSEDFRKAVKNFYSNYHKDQKVPQLIRNRRYKKLQELIDGAEYFSEERIKFRDPLLYFIYIGRYKREGGPTQNSTFFELLTQQMMNKEYESTLNEAWLSEYGREFDQTSFKEKELTLEKLENHEDELIQLMHEKFLAGYDQGFIDYHEIDDNELYDDLKQETIDKEDQYFDDENEESNFQNVDHSEYTGVQDY